jgi:hypothetical protein
MQRIDQPQMHPSSGPGRSLFAISMDIMMIREMSHSPDARAELLCYLVATAAATYALTRDWRVDHVVSTPADRGSRETVSACRGLTEFAWGS